jgi:dUTP pyrophosphatase
VSRDVRIAANSFEDVHSDIAVELPAGYWARVTGRSSSLRVHGLLVSEGVIDGGYRGELFVGVWNLRGVPVTVKAGWRIAQIIIVPLVVLPWTEVNELGESGRGRNGFGSTGV